MMRKARKQLLRMFTWTMQTECTRIEEYNLPFTEKCVESGRIIHKKEDEGDDEQ